MREMSTICRTCLLREYHPGWALRGRTCDAALTKLQYVFGTVVCGFEPSGRIFYIDPHLDVSPVEIATDFQRLRSRRIREGQGDQCGGNR